MIISGLKTFAGGVMMRVGLAQLAPVLGEVEENLRLHEEMIRRAVSEQVDLLVFPELSLTGYSLGERTPDAARMATDEDILALASLTEKTDVVFGFAEESEDHVFYNSAAYLSQGRIQTVHRKTYLPTYGRFQEGRYFGRGGRIRGVETRFGRVGVAICEEAWHPSVPYLLAQEGAKFLLVMANGPVKEVGEEASQEPWHRILSTYSMLYGVCTIFVNRAGMEEGVRFFGGSAVFDPFGGKVEEAPLLESGLFTYDINPSTVRQARWQMPSSLRDEDLDLTLRELERIRELRR